MRSGYTRLGRGLALIVLVGVVGLLTDRNAVQPPPAAAAPSHLRWGYHITYDSTSLTSLQQHIGQLDIVSPYYYELRADGTIQEAVEPNSLALMQSAKVTIVPMIKNQSRWDDFRTTIETPEKRDAIVDRLVELVNRNSYHGIHIDFEAVNAADAPLLTDFMQRLSAKLRPQGKLVTQAVVARASDTSTTWGGAYDYRALAAINDYIVIMAYDFHSVGSAPGPIGPLRGVRNVVNYAKTRIPASSIILGIGLYGYDWDTTDDSPAKSLRYSQTTGLLSRPGVTSGYDTVDQSPWLRYTDDAGHTHDVWYENAESFRAKVQVMIDHGLGGFGVWRLGHEDPNVWNEIARLNTPATRIPPFTPNRDRNYFQETGHSLAYGFKSFWERSGGLAVFGYPHTEEFDERNPDTNVNYTVQYFERQRFEYHPELKDTPYEVLLGRLGVTDADRLGLLNTSAFRALPASTAPGAGCAYFAETGHTLCGRFHEYFRAHGLEFGDPGFSFRESLALFGYPISEPYTDPTTGLVVQYFERARFESHPEIAAPYDVLLGLLGTDAVRAKGWIR